MRHFVRKPEDAGDPTAMMVASPASQKYRAEEELLAGTWWKQGLMINSSSGCLSEEYGWCCIMFTVDPDCLRVGLQRFVDGLKEVGATKSVANLAVSIEKARL